MTTTTPDAILTFWFSDRVKPLWFNSTPDFDTELKTKFLVTYQQARAGILRDWQECPQGALALVLIFDQFPLNMFRGQKEGFESEENARQVARYAIDLQLDKALPDEQKAFLYLPFMHSESLDDQNYSVELFAAANLKENLKYAQHHREIIERFGRFPHRNKILGRVSTAEEEAYLSSSDAFLG